MLFIFQHRVRRCEAHPRHLRLMRIFRPGVGGILFIHILTVQRRFWRPPRPCWALLFLIRFFFSTKVSGVQSMASSSTPHIPSATHTPPVTRSPAFLPLVVFFVRPPPRPSGTLARRGGMHCLALINRRGLLAPQGIMPLSFGALGNTATVLLLHVGRRLV